MEAEEQRRAHWFHLRVQDVASGSDSHERGEQSGRVLAPLRKETPRSNAKRLFFFLLLCRPPGRPNKQLLISAISYSDSKQAPCRCAAPDSGIFFVLFFFNYVLEEPVFV